MDRKALEKKGTKNGKKRSLKFSQRLQTSLKSLRFKTKDYYPILSSERNIPRDSRKFFISQ